MAARYTPWFDATKHKPKRVGVYQMRDWVCDLIYRPFWNGRHWEWADARGGRFPIQPGDKWRGLTEKAD